MRRIRQGQTRWRLEILRGPDGLPERVYVYQCLVTRVHWAFIDYRDEAGSRATSHWGWRQFHATYRRAMREAWTMVRETDRRRDAEFTRAWQQHP